MKTTTLKTKAMSILLAIVMLLGMLPMGAFAVNTKPSYVALGDSISTGYGLADETTQGFAYMLANSLGLTLTNLAVDGNTAAGVLTQLSDETVQTAVAGADLITITAGGNDLMAVLYQAIAEQYNVSQAGASDPITAAEVPGLLTGSDIIKKLTLMSIALDLLDKDTELDSDIYLIDTSAFTEAVTAYITTLKQVTAAIIAENPDATILVATQYNPYVDFKEAKYEAFGTIDLNPIYAGMEAGVAALNTAIKNNAATGGYTVADVKAAFDAYTGTGDLYNADPTNLNIDFHPTAAGHAIIADTFAAAIPVSQPEVYVGGVGMADGTYLANGAASTTTTAPASGGYAHYKDGTLTLSNYEYEGEGYWYATDYSSVIYAPGGLKIVLVGQSTITNTKLYCDGINVVEDLTISGEGALSLYASYGICGSNITINGGSLDITVYDEGFYISDGDFTINGGVLNVTANDGIEVSGSVYFNGGISIIDAIHGYMTVNSDDRIYIGDGMEILLPEDAVIKDDYGYYFEDADGETGIRIAIGPVGTALPEIYVGGVGMADGTYLANDATATTTTAPASSSYAYYKDGTLTLSNYTYSGEGYLYNSDYTSVIYSPYALDIVLQGENAITNTEGGGDGITVEADLTISGSGSIDITADYAIISSDVDITVSGGIAITADFGISASGDVTVSGGIIDIVSNLQGISCDGTVTFSGGTTTIDASDGYETVGAMDDIVFTNVEILEPEGAVIEEDPDGWKYICDSEGYSNIKVVIGTVTKADQDKPTVGKTDETIFNKKDGSITDVSSAMEYRKEGQTTYTAISGDTVSNLAAGKYYVRIKGDSTHNPSDDTEVTINAGRKLTVKIPSSAEQIGYVLTANATQLDWQGEFVLEYRLLDGYTETEDFAIKVNGDKITLTDNRYNMSDVETDIEITVEGIKDKTLPEAEISISTNKWTEFLNTITFGLFFTETQDITITATDKGSGVDKIYYLISDDKLKEEDVKALVNNYWTEYNAATKPSISPDRECIVYVKVIDKAQNVKYISSDGLVFDSTAPTLEGIENGKTYYGDLTVTIPTDQFGDIAQVTLDGEPMNFAEGTYGLIPADNEEHTVVATDKAGNKTEYKITVYKVYKIILKNPSFDFQFPVNHGMSFNEAHPDTVQDMVAEKEYHTFIGWYESTDGGETLKDTPYDFDAKVTGDITLYPLFEKSAYTVNIEESHYVGCTVSGGGIYQHGQTVTVTASPADSIKFQYWLDTSVQLSDEPTEAELRAAIVSYDATYTFTAEKDVSLAAVFSGSEEIGITAMFIVGTDEKSLSDAERMDVEYDFGTVTPGAEQIVLPGEIIKDTVTIGDKHYRFAGFITFGYDDATETDTVELKETLTIGKMPLYNSAEYWNWFISISDGVYAAYMEYTPEEPENPNDPQTPEEPDSEKPDPEKPSEPETPNNPQTPTDPEKSDDSQKPSSPQTGDNSHLVLWIALLFISGGGVFGTILYRRKSFL